MAQELLGLARLPQLTRELAESVRSGGEGLGRGAVERALSLSGDGSAPVLQRLRLDWRLRIAKRKQKVFFFFRREGPEEPVLDAGIRFVFLPAPPDGAHPGTGGVLHYRLLAPPVLVAAPSAAELERYAPGAEATTANTLLLTTGPRREHVLAVVLRDPVRIFHTEDTAAAEEVRPDEAERWPLRPFVAVVMALAAWARGSLGPGEEIPLRVEGRERDVPRLVHHVVEGYRQSRHSRRPPGDARWRFAEPYVPAYAVEDYEAVVSLRLDEDGQIGLGEGKKTSQLGLALRVGPSGPDAIARLALTVPDFLADGEVLERILEKLVADGVADIARQLEKRGVAVAPAEVSAFLRDAERRILVFRIERRARDGRKHRDTDIVAVRGVLGRAERLLLLRVKLEAEPDEEGRTSFTLRDLDVLYAGTVDGSEGAIDEDLARYFVRLARTLKRWIGVLE